MTEHPAMPEHPEMLAGQRTGSSESRLPLFRHGAIIVIIVSLSITALIGIITLVTGSFGEAQARIMLTTLLIGVTSVIALCDLAVLCRHFRMVGLVGLVAAAVTLVVGLILIWSGNASDALVKTFALAGIAAASLAHANLLLLLGERRRPVVRIGLWVTVGLITLLLVLLYLLVLTDGEIGNDGYARLVGTVAILDVLGTIVVPVISIFLKDENSSPAHSSITLPAPLTARVAEAARRNGMTSEQFVVDVVERSVEATDLS